MKLKSAFKEKNRFFFIEILISYLIVNEEFAIYLSDFTTGLYDY